MVKAAGHDEEEIMEELKNIQNGESFPGFSDLPLSKTTSSSKPNRKD